jgi:hypothetical protein
MDIKYRILDELESKDADSIKLVGSNSQIDQKIFFRNQKSHSVVKLTL